MSAIGDDMPRQRARFDPKLSNALQPYMLTLDPCLYAGT